jgi:hypothetical protein
MRDLGKAMIPAVNDFVGELDGEIPVLSCHSHFLADVGKDLLDGSHGELRALFRRFKVRPNLGLLARELGRKIGVDIVDARQEVRNWQEQIDEGHVVPRGRAGLATVRSLAQWVLDFKADGTDLGFPFDRPYLDLYDRCVTARRATDAFLRTMPDDKQLQRALKRLARFLEPVVCEKVFKEVAVRLRKRTELFDELRDALRLTQKSGGRNTTSAQQSLDLEEAVAELRNVQVAVENFVASLGERRPERGPAQDIREAIDTILEHIEIHGESLWGHVVCLPTPDGDVVIRIVDRTNNVLESEFGALKRGERRRSGRKILTQDFERLPAAAALTSNLNRPDYVKFLCGSLDALPQAFAELDAARRHKALTEQPLTPLGRSEQPIPEIASAAFPTADRPLIRSKEMRRRVFAAAKSRAPKTPAKRNFSRAATAN